MTSQPTSSFASTAGPPPPPEAEPTPRAGSASAPERPRGAGRAIGYAFAVVPLALAGLLELLMPGFLAPLADRRISLMGMPAGFYAVALLVLLTGIGILAARSIRQPVVVALVLVFTTLLAITVVVFAPAFILIAINLKS